MQVSQPDTFSIQYDAAQDLLIGRWHHTSKAEDLYPAYYQLLAAAKAHGNCRFWLLDMRQRTWHTAAFAKWFSELLAHRVVREIGAPVFVAYVAGEVHRADIESVVTEAMLRQVAELEFYPYFFNNEMTARDWVVYYQTHPNQAPVV